MLKCLSTLLLPWQMILLLGILPHGRPGMLCKPTLVFISPSKSLFSTTGLDFFLSKCDQQLGFEM